MARNWIVLTATRDPHPINEIVAYTEWDNYTAAVDEVVYTDPENSGGDAVDAGWRVGGSVTFVGGVYTYTPPDGIPTQADLWIGDLADAYHTYLGVRTESWVSRRTGASARVPMVATDRWAYAQIALGDALARSVWLPALTDTQRTAAVEHIVDLITRIGAVWYSVMVSAYDTDPSNNVAVSWAGWPIADGTTPIYSDIITAAGAPRAADGAFNPLPGAAIPTGFNPDTHTLR